MEYKRVKKTVPWCEKCEQEISGNGSGFLPYQCECGTWEFNLEKCKYILNKKNN